MKKKISLLYHTNNNDILFDKFTNIIKFEKEHNFTINIITNV